jgi:hypothetical protein
MNNSFRRWNALLLALSLMLAAGISSASAQSTSSGASTTAKPADPTLPTGAAPPAQPAPDTKIPPKTTSKSVGIPSAQEIAAAKSSGKVWVNTETGMYHKGGRWYGKTKTGKFMTESEAKTAGYKEAHR